MAPVAAQQLIADGTYSLSRACDAGVPVRAVGGVAAGWRLACFSSSGVSGLRGASTLPLSCWLALGSVAVLAAPAATAATKRRAAAVTAGAANTATDPSASQEESGLHRRALHRLAAAPCCRNWLRVACLL